MKFLKLSKNDKEKEKNCKKDDKKDIKKDIYKPSEAKEVKEPKKAGDSKKPEEKEKAENAKTEDRKPFVYKPLKQEKMTIILVEDTEFVAKEADIINKLLKKIVTSNSIVIIRYGENVKISKISENSLLNEARFVCTEDSGDKACLSDALLILYQIVSNCYQKIQEFESKKVIIDSIDIIGVGTCLDNCSKNKKEVGIEGFAEIAKESKITTKYYCITENSFVQAAEIGFRSIGSITRTYKQ